MLIVCFSCEKNSTGGDENLLETEFIGSIGETVNATDITDNSAILNGVVQPNSESVSISFLLSEVNDISFQQISIKAVPDNLYSSTKWTQVYAKATELTSNTTYCFALLIKNDSTICGWKSFTTLK